MAYPAEVGRSQSEAGFTSRVSFPGKSEIAGASADPARILVINRLFVEALNLLGLSTVDVPGPVLRAVVSKVLEGGPRCGRIDNSHEQQFVDDTTAKSASSWLFYLAGCHRRGPLLLYQRTPRTGLPEAPQPTLPEAPIADPAVAASWLSLALNWFCRNKVASKSCPTSFSPH